jgi:thiol:disulfide interchange protein DsbC
MKIRFYLLLFIFISIEISADEELKKRFQESLSRLSSDFEITDVKATPIKGVYQVTIGPDIVYMTKDGNYVLKGEILDISNRRNITEDVRAENRVHLLNTISEKEYIEFSPSLTKNYIYVFTDTDCGYCRKLHRDVPELNSMGIAVRYLAYPRTGVDSKIGDEMRDVWCASDRRKALTAAKNREQFQSKPCDAPIARHYALGKELGVSGTPAIFLENGIKLPGYIPPDEIYRQIHN